MIRKITLLLLVCLAVSRVTYSQPICGFDGAHQQLMSQNPGYAQHISQMHQQAAQWMSNNPNINALLTTNANGDTLYEIPVVVHVMHTGGAIGTIYNIPDTRIDSTIDYVNQVFAATWPGYAQAGSGGFRFPIRFALAKRDPSCGSTSGIVRVNVSSTYSNYTLSGINKPSGTKVTGVNDVPLKALSKWPNDRYYNIWVVNKIDSVDGYPGSSGPFTAGYAYLPGAPSDRDGTIMLASQMKPGATTLPHELGHAWGLLHTFEDADLTKGPPTNLRCPPNVNCNADGDGVCDTQPHWVYGPGGCTVGQFNECASANFDLATAKNIMNYSNCEDRFTAGQVARFYNFMQGVDRSSLLSSSASIPMPATSLPSVCVPGINNPSSAVNAGPQDVAVFDGSRTYMNVHYGAYVDDNAAYMDYTCKHRISLVAGKTYQIRFTSVFQNIGAVYIDYNNDGILGNPASERLNVTDSAGGNVHKATFTVPVDATACTPIRMRVIADFGVTSLDSCKNMAHGQTEDYEVLIYGTNSTGTTVTISNPPTGGNPSCFGTQLTFKATPATGTNVAGYQWYINSTAVSGQTADSISSTIFADKDTVYVKMFYTTPCGIDSNISNKVVVERRATIAPAVTIGVTGGTNPTCIDDTVTLAVVSNVNPGASPQYQWRVDGVDVSGANGPTFKAFNMIGKKITVLMVSSAPSPCSDPGFALSNEIEIKDTQKRPVANIALTVGTNPGCAGQPLQFTVNPTVGGTAPTYQWIVNGSPVSGATGKTFNSSTLSNNDTVRVIMTSNSPCATPKTVLSDSIVVKHEKITADISIAQTTGTNPACEGKPLIFSANTSNAGKNPKFQWIVNGVPMTGATTPIYVTDSLNNLDSIQCVLIATDSCVANPLDTSNAIKMGIITSLRPSVTVAITAGKNPGCLDSLIEFTATEKDLGSNPAFTWIINGFPAASGNVFSNSSFQDGDIIMMRANQTDGGCYLPDTVYSTPIVLVRSATPEPPVISLIGNTMYTDFDSSFVWFGPDGQMPDGPEGKAYPSKIGAYWAVTNNRGCWSAPSNILRITLLDISSLDIRDMDVYPNPASDKVVLDWNGQLVDYTIDVYNAVGQVVVRETAKNVARKEVSVANLAAGNYFILLKDSEGRVGVIKIAVDR